MRKTVLIVTAFSLVLLALSGCINSPPSQPSASQSPTSSHGNTPDATDGPGSGGVSNGMLIRPVHEENTTNGFFLAGDESASGFMQGDNVTFTFTAENRSADALALRDPCGNGNPRAHIEDASGKILQIMPPAVHCMAMADFAPFANSANVSRELTWNGTVYDGEKASMTPPGTYYAVATFEGKRADVVVEVTVRVPVNVFEKSSTMIL